MGRALSEGRVEVVLTNLRDFAPDERGTVDDKPFGGGPGMVLMCDPVFKAVEHVQALDARRAMVVLLTPQGERLTQNRVCDLAGRERLILVCGHYEGFDERIRTLADLELSIGDYVLTGGELPALVVIDAVTRLQPGALGAEDGAAEESFSAGLRPDGSGLRLAGRGCLSIRSTRGREYRGLAVPEVLVSGNHAAIAKWRAEQAQERTRRRRADLAGEVPDEYAMTFTLAGHLGGRALFEDKGLKMKQRKGRTMKNAAIMRVEAGVLVKDRTDFHVGDTVDIGVKIIEGDKERIQVFTGVVTGRRGGGATETFTVRRMVAGEGVERTFPLHSPTVAFIRVVRSGASAGPNYVPRKRVGKATRLEEQKRAVYVPGEDSAPAAEAEQA